MCLKTKLLKGEIIPILSDSDLLQKLQTKHESFRIFNGNASIRRWRTLIFKNGNIFFHNNQCPQRLYQHWYDSCFSFKVCKIGNQYPQ